MNPRHEAYDMLGGRYEARVLEPYLYVAPSVAPPAGELWQASGFSGAELSYAELLSADAPREAALDFFRARLAALSA
jgi:hypothetical protein